MEGIVSAKEAYGGILVTSGVFSEDALAFAADSHIELIDGERLHRLIPHIEQTESIISPASTIPNCPKCGSQMVIRTAKRGQNAGNHFWGCTTYPKCKGTVNIEEI